MASSASQGPVCGIENCRSRLYEEGEDGYLYCQNGHRKGELRTAKDDGDFSAARKEVTKKKLGADTNDKQYRYYKGNKAFDLYLKSIQLVLRHQIFFLVQHKGLPPELESVVHDLWELRILQLEERVGGVESYYSETLVDSTDETNTDAEREKSNLRPSENILKATPNLIDCLALCYLGVILLRIPATSGDFIKWAMDAEMPYKRASRYVPAMMRDKLPPAFYSSFDPNASLSPERIQRYILRNAIHLGKHYGILWPKLNHALLLFRLLKELALPLELYHPATQLALYLDYSLKLPSEDSTYAAVHNIPEAQLLACLVVCIKLIYPFDGTSRHPETPLEPAATLIDWHAWSEATKVRGDAFKMSAHVRLTDTQEKDIFTMSTGDLDQYLDWYQDSFIDNTTIAPINDGRFDCEMFRMFPIGRDTPAPETMERLGYAGQLGVVQAVQATMKPRTIRVKGDVRAEAVRPGRTFQHYRKVAQLPKLAKQFHEEAADIIGLSLEMLLKAVCMTEKRMERWMVERRRADQQAMQSSLDLDIS